MGFEMPLWAHNKGMTPAQYDAEMNRRSENFFDSSGNYIENIPPTEQSDAVTFVAGLALLTITAARLAFWFLVICGALYGAGKLFGWL